MIKFTVEQMARRHLDKLVELEKKCFSVPWSEKSLESELNNEGSYFLVAVNDENVVLGYIGLKFVCDEGYITNIAVFPQYRRNGVAKKLLSDIMELANKRKLKFISLEVRQSNNIAISLYRSLGFSSVGVRKAFYSFPKEDAVIMTKYLNIKS